MCHHHSAHCVMRGSWVARRHCVLCSIEMSLLSSLLILDQPLPRRIKWAQVMQDRFIGDPVCHLPHCPSSSIPPFSQVNKLRSLLFSNKLKSLLTSSLKTCILVTRVKIRALSGGRKGAGKWNRENSRGPEVAVLSDVLSKESRLSWSVKNDKPVWPGELCRCLGRDITACLALSVPQPPPLLPWLVSHRTDPPAKGRH